MSPYFEGVTAIPKGSREQSRSATPLEHARVKIWSDLHGDMQLTQ